MFKKNKKQTETIKEPKEKKVRTVKVYKGVVPTGFSYRSNTLIIYHINPI